MEISFQKSVRNLSLKGGDRVFLVGKKGGERHKEPTHKKEHTGVSTQEKKIKSRRKN